jgi:hypothetical protein
MSSEAESKSPIREEIGEICINQSVDQDDPFDLAKLRLSQDFAAYLGVKKAMLTVPVRRPNNQEFFRVHPGEDWRLETPVLELKEEREVYLVSPTCRMQLHRELIPKVLYTVINRQGVLSLWPIRLPGEDGRIDGWNRSALEAAGFAQEHWIRLSSNRSLNAYEVYQATAAIPEPEWPDTTFKNILEVAFKDRYITSLDHTVVRRLLGEV